MTMPQPPRPQVRATTLWVRRTFPQGEEFEQQNIEVAVFATEPASAYAKAGRTINLGNYESFKVELGVTVPCYLEELNEGIETAFSLAGAKLGEEVARITAALNKTDKVADAPTGK